MPENADYVRGLECRIGAYMRVLEAMFGPRDPRFVYGSIKKSDGSPQLHFPNNYNLCGGCVVDIWIGEWPYTNRSPDQGPWQLAPYLKSHLSGVDAHTLDALCEKFRY